MQRFTRPLFEQVLIALAVGIALGIWTPELAQKLQPLGGGFLELVKMLIVPIVFPAMVVEVYGADELREAGHIGDKVVIYSEIVTTTALVLSVALACLFGSGHGMDVNPKSLDPTAMTSYMMTAKQMESTGVTALFLELIPDTFVSGPVRSDILQVLLMSILFGCSLSLLGERAKPPVNLIGQLSRVLSHVVAVIIRLAPLGVLDTVTFATGEYGTGSLKQLGSLALLFCAAVAIFVAVVLDMILCMAGFNVLKLIRFLHAELLVVLGTALSDAVLSSIMNKLGRMSVKRSVVGLVIPTGYSSNLDAFSIYLTLAAVLIIQTANTPLTLQDLLLTLDVALVIPKDAHSIPDSAIVIPAATLSIILAIPAIGLVLVLSIGWFIGITRALDDLIGNCIATVVIVAWEEDINHVRANAVLDGKIDITEGGEVILHGPGVTAPAAHTLPHA